MIYAQKSSQACANCAFVVHKRCADTLLESCKPDERLELLADAPRLLDLSVAAAAAPAPSDDHTAPPPSVDSFSGWLQKRGRRVKSWKRRFFVLEGGVLRYYAQEDVQRARGPLGEVSLVGARVRPPQAGSLQFAVESPSRVLWLNAADMRDLQQWCRALVLQIARADADWGGGDLAISTPALHTSSAVSDDATPRPAADRVRVLRLRDTAPGTDAADSFGGLERELQQTLLGQQQPATTEHVLAEDADFRRRTVRGYRQSVLGESSSGGGGGGDVQRSLRGVRGVCPLFFAASPCAPLTYDIGTRRLAVRVHRDGSSGKLHNVSVSESLAQVLRRVRREESGQERQGPLVMRRADGSRARFVFVIDGDTLYWQDDAGRVRHGSWALPGSMVSVCQDEQHDRLLPASRSASRSPTPSPRRSASAADVDDRSSPAVVASSVMLAVSAGDLLEEQRRSGRHASAPQHVLELSAETDVDGVTHSRVLMLETESSDELTEWILALGSVASRAPPSEQYHAGMCKLPAADGDAFPYPQHDKSVPLRGDEPATTNDNDDDEDEGEEENDDDLLVRRLHTCEYLIDLHAPLISYCVVQQCAAEREPLELEVLPRPPPSNDPVSPRRALLPRLRRKANADVIGEQTTTHLREIAAWIDDHLGGAPHGARSELAAMPGDAIGDGGSDDGTFEAIDAASVHSAFSCRVLSVTNTTEPLAACLAAERDADVYVRLSLLLGDAALCPRVYTVPVSSSQNLVWTRWRAFEYTVAHLSPDVRLRVDVVCRQRQQDRVLATADMPLYDARARLVSGVLALPLVHESVDSLAVTLQFPRLQLPVVCVPAAAVGGDGEAAAPPDDAAHDNLVRVLREPLPPLRSQLTLTAGERALLWRHRHWCLAVDDSNVDGDRDTDDALLPATGLHRLPWALACCPVPHRMALDALLEAHWRQFAPVATAHEHVELALALLSPLFASDAVLRYAARLLEAAASDADLMLHMMSLVQAARRATQHYNALVALLLRRALRARHTVGGAFFWCVLAECGDRFAARADRGRRRLCLYAEAYFALCGDEQRHVLLAQVALDAHLRQVQAEVREARGDERTRLLRERLRAWNARGSAATVGQRLPNTAPAKSAAAFVVERCRVLPSATLPLYLVLDTGGGGGDSGELHAIYKVGDDLRQDALILQAFATMRDVWRRAVALDCRMRLYTVQATGPSRGFVEVVRHARTIASLQMADGGMRSAFKKTPLGAWLRAQCRDEHAYARAVDNFTASLVGFSVATYVLGIGDRHNDNVLLDATGHLFHIDFGKIGGNWQRFAGISRDRAPFVYTEQMAFVLGRENHERYVRLCCDAYVAVRRRHALVLSLFHAMLGAGIEQLEHSQALAFIRNALRLELGEQEARAFFADRVEESLRTRSQNINFFVHMAASARGAK